MIYLCLSISMFVLLKELTFLVYLTVKDIEHDLDIEGEDGYIAMEALCEVMLKEDYLNVLIFTLSVIVLNKHSTYGL